MAKQFVQNVTGMDEDFAQWYTDVVTKAELIDYSSVRGSMIIRPYGYAIWENIKDALDGKIKETGHENVYMPLFIPESLLQREKDHIEGFAPEVAWVTHGGEDELRRSWTQRWRSYFEQSRQGILPRHRRKRRTSHIRSQLIRKEGHTYG